ncbi:MAG: isoaspartyl peptidase/L-asparaginase [Gammaproteobacteria bacterium]|nr:isoaspartyl peptidase/L-asparaginase [Gammaproteobacteria bacterium]
MTAPRTFTLFLVLLCSSLHAEGVPPTAPVAIAIHAGAGTIKRDELSSEAEAEIRATLEKAVRAGHAALTSGQPGVEAVRAAVNILEDSPLFNAGKGAVFNAQAQNELDASIMDGASLNAGAVAALKRVRNPIDLAISVMNQSRHVMMIGVGAEQFAIEQGFELVDPSYFHTDHRLEQLRERQADEQANVKQDEAWYSTVGAVVLDQSGNLAAGTSTGGLTNKRWGRIGDTPIIGAGNYANNNGCAVSATGTGEYFIRHVVAHSICMRVAGGQAIAEAADGLIFDTLLPDGGDGGVIAMDPKGEIAFSFNTAGMYRASIDRNGKLYVGIYANE